jgi:type IX secretion system PorP/SprF family membrane protein
MLTAGMQAQDLQFSQFSSAPLHVNPAMVGIVHDGGNLTLQYRSQWQSLLGDNAAFKTMAVSYEHRKNTSKEGYFGIGGTLWRDKAGPITQTDVRASLCYAKQMAGSQKVKHYLIGGGEVGYMNRVIDLSDRTWLNQYDGYGGFDPNKYGETIDFPKTNKIDVSMGLVWYSIFEKGNYFTLGAAMHHLNRADVSANFNSSTPNLYTRYTINGAADIRLNRTLRVVPSFLIMSQGPNLQILPGAGIKFMISEDVRNYTTFQLGVWSRMVNKLEQGISPESYIGVVKIDYLKYTFGLSYDFTVSSLNQFNSAANSLELTLSYRIGGKIGDHFQNVQPRYF